MRKEMVDFLKGHFFRDETLALLNDMNLAILAKQYGYKAEVTAN